MASSSGFGKIIVAFDGSADSTKAVRLAASLASKNDSSVILVHVYHSPAIGLSAASGMPIPDYGDLEDAAKASGQSVLSKGIQFAKGLGITARGELIEAPSVVEAIVNFSASEKADLIVVGTRGMTGFKQLILGSVSSGLVSHARCPVLVAR
ncbi:MAG: universal stress protein [Nitrososphaerota archaeon]|nr:universal stress protein [Nitrososphaerota archaeon]MDG7023538.1 universal stress protein [Nitrososphaerota archaeon]